jgi:hypothetical protein
MRTLLPSTLIALCIISCGPPRNQAPICCEHAPNEPGMTNLAPQKGLEPDSVSPNAADLLIDPIYTGVRVLGETSYVFQTCIRNLGNNCADSDQSYAIITLPQQTKVRNVLAISLHRPARFLHYAQCQGQLTVRLDSLCPKYSGNFLAVQVDRSPYRHPECAPAFSVHVYSTTPDPDPSNNYWWWRRQCGGGSDDWTPDDPTWGPQ